MYTACVAVFYRGRRGPPYTLGQLGHAEPFGSSRYESNLYIVIPPLDPLLYAWCALVSVARQVDPTTDISHVLLFLGLTFIGLSYKQIGKLLMQLDDFIVHKHDDSEPGEEDINSVYAALNENNFETIILPTEKTRSTVVTAKNNKIN